MMRPAARGCPLAAAIAVLVLASGCSEGGLSAGARTARADTLPTGRIEVANSVPAWTSSTAWRLEEELRLGSHGTGKPDEFGRIGAVVADSQGRIYVLDVLSQQIKVFEPTGAFSHVIGGSGEGPGEFSGGAGMRFGAGDTLWVVDPVNRRYSGFARDGTLLASHPRRIRGNASPGEFMDDGRFLDWALSFPGERPGIVAGPRIVHHPILVSRDFDSQDTLPPVEYTREMMANGMLPQPFFSNDLEVAVDPNGSIWLAEARAYRVVRRSLGGDTSLVFTLAADPAPLGDVEREYVRRRAANRPDLLNAYLDALPQFRPIVRLIFTDGAGHVFVLADVAGVSPGTRVDVFEEDGKYLGRMELPGRVPLLGSQRPLAFATVDHLYAVVTDSLDVPYVSRSRIRRE